MDSLERQSSQEKQQATALEAKITDLTRLLHDREAIIDQQEELLAHDRDIRDLMGARDLYVAEVYGLTTRLLIFVCWRNIAISLTDLGFWSTNGAS